MTERAENFENELRQAVRSLPSPEPSEALLARILEDRKNGLRIELPAAIRPAVRPAFIGIAVAAAALVLWVAVVRHGSSEEQAESSAISDLAIGMGLWPDQLYAQGAATSQLPPIPPRDGSLLKSGQWVYAIHAVDQNGRIRFDRVDTVSITKGGYGQQGAWIVVRTRAFPAVDSSWFTTDSLHPLADFFRLRGGSTLLTTYTGDSAVRIWRQPDGTVEQIAAALPSPRLWDNAAVSGPTTLWPLFMTTPLNSTWLGSYAGTGIANTRQLVTFWWDLRVTGEERITVPGGTFLCWKVALVFRGDPAYMYWVDKATGWIVRESAEPYAHFSRELVSHAAD